MPPVKIPQTAPENKQRVNIRRVAKKMTSGVQTVDSHIDVDAIEEIELTSDKFEDVSELHIPPP